MPQLMPNITDILVHIDNKIYIDSGLLSTDKVDNFEKVFLEWMTTWHTTDNIKFTHIDWSTDKALSDLKWMTGGFLIRNGYVFWSQPEDGESDPATCVFPRDQTRCVQTHDIPHTLIFGKDKSAASPALPNLHCLWIATVPNLARTTGLSQGYV